MDDFKQVVMEQVAMSMAEQLASYMNIALKDIALEEKLEIARERGLTKAWLDMLSAPPTVLEEEGVWRAADGLWTKYDLGLSLDKLLPIDKKIGDITRVGDRSFVVNSHYVSALHLFAKFLMENGHNNDAGKVDTLATKIGE